LPQEIPLTPFLLIQFCGSSSLAPPQLLSNQMSERMKKTIADTWRALLSNPKREGNWESPATIKWPRWEMPETCPGVRVCGPRDSRSLRMVDILCVEPEHVPHRVYRERTAHPAGGQQVWCSGCPMCWHSRNYHPTQLYIKVSQFIQALDLAHFDDCEFLLDADLGVPPRVRATWPCWGPWALHGSEGMWGPLPTMPLDALAAAHAHGGAPPSTSSTWVMAWVPVAPPP